MLSHQYQRTVGSQMKVSLVESHCANQPQAFTQKGKGSYDHITEVSSRTREAGQKLLREPHSSHGYSPGDFITELAIFDVFFNTIPLVILDISDPIKQKKDFPALAFPVESLNVKVFKTTKHSKKALLFLLKMVKPLCNF